MNVSARITTITSREFNQDTAGAKRAAENGPVFITDRGRPSHVLLTKEQFDRLEGKEKEPEKKFVSLAEALADPRPEADFDFEFPELKGPSTLKIPDFD